MIRCTVISIVAAIALGGTALAQDKPELAKVRIGVGGSVDVASGAYEHTITIQPKGQNIQAFAAQGRYPGFALGIGKARAVREGISPDGLFPRQGVENTLKMLRAFDPGVKSASIRLEDTYTNRFVGQALRAVKR